MKRSGLRLYRKGLSPTLSVGSSTISCTKDTGSDLQCPLAKVHRFFLLALKINTEILIRSENAAGTHRERMQLPAVGPEELAWLQFWLSGKESHRWGAESIRVKKGVKKPCVTCL